MTSFLDFISDMRTPEQQIMEAIEKDDVAKLKSLLSSHPRFQQESEELSTHKNLLHYAISQRSQSCVHHLLHVAKWSVTFATVAHEQRFWNAVSYAVTDAYFPVLYMVLRRYCGTETTSPFGTWLQLHEKLPRTAPHFCLMDYLLTPNSDNRQSLIECLRGGRTMPMKPHPVYLATELLLTEEKPPSTDNTNTSSTPWTPYEAQGLIPGNDSELDSWWATLSKQPLYLSETARRCIRRTLVKSANTAPSRDCNQENYFHRVDRLPLPELLKRYLSYADLWPLQAKEERATFVRRGVCQWRQAPHLWQMLPLVDEGFVLDNLEQA